jgi:adenosylhomocysteine nucleosidase
MNLSFKVAFIAALDREIAPLVKHWCRTQCEHSGRHFTFYEQNDVVAVCGGIGIGPARRAAEAAISLYHPRHLHSVGFAGALRPELHIGDIFSPSVVIDARDGSRTQLEAGEGTLITFSTVADSTQKTKLAHAYAARAVDMEAAAVATAAQAHGITFGATKVISDELDFEMPSMSRFINCDGQFNSAGFALFITPRPWLWPSVAALARNSRIASQSLSSCLERFCKDIPQSTASKSSPARAKGTR